MTKEQIEDIAWKRTKKEVKDGIQTIQYQVNTLQTTNGQAPFVSLLMHFDPDSEYAKESALITEEILRQRLEGIKNEQGVYVTPVFPKLIYVLDEHNIHEDSEYYYLTKLSIACTAKRMYPDYISAKKMKENYDGEVFAPMGCRAFLSLWKDKDTGKYVTDGRGNMGVVSINLVQPALISQSEKNEEERIEKYFELLQSRLDLSFRALMTKYNLLKDIKTDVAPIMWRDGALARLPKGQKVGEIMSNGYMTISLGYVGIYEAVLALTDESHTSKKGKDIAMRIMDLLNENVNKWKAETGLGFALYGTPNFRLGADTVMYHEKIA